MYYRLFVYFGLEVENDDEIEEKREWGTANEMK